MLGMRSAQAANLKWEAVISVPARRALPNGISRTTGETLVLLIREAKRHLRIAAPFFDVEGVSYLIPPLLAAAERGVTVAVAASRTGASVVALRRLLSEFARAGRGSQMAAGFPESDKSWSHLKVVTADSMTAYVGSANMTGAALSGRNLELGVLVRGHAVAQIEQAIERLFDDA